MELSQKEFSQIVGYSYQGIKQWKDDSIPRWAWIVLNHLEDMQRCRQREKEYLV